MSKKCSENIGSFLATRHSLIAESAKRLKARSTNWLLTSADLADLIIVVNNVLSKCRVRRSATSYF